MINRSTSILHEMSSPFIKNGRNTPTILLVVEWIAPSSNIEKDVNSLKPLDCQILRQCLDTNRIRYKVAENRKPH